MAEVEALAQLKDIHLPEAVGWWPPAPGWYGVMVVIFGLIVLITLLAYRRYLNAQAKKQALVLLKTYIVQYEKDRNTQLMSARVSELLKRVALVYFPRHQVASIHGQEWIDFLSKTGKKIDFEPVKTMLLDLPFKPNDKTNLDPLLIRAKLWIQQRKVPCSN